MVSALFVLAGVQTAGRPTGSRPQSPRPEDHLPVWSSQSFSAGDARSRAIRDEIRRRFRNAKSAAEARSLAQPFLRSAKSSADASYKAMVALYYRTVVTGAYTGRAEALTLWPTFAKFANPTSPEHARVFCDVASITRTGKVRYETALRTFEKYRNEPDILFLSSAAAASAHESRNVPGLERIARLTKERATGLKPNEIVDYLGSGPEARASLLFLAGTCFERAAWVAADRRHGHAAAELFAATTQTSGVSERLKQKAQGAREAMLAMPFMH